MNCNNIHLKERNMYNHITNIFLCRDATDSLLKGVLTQESYAYGHSRAMVSLKICVSSCLYELIGTVITAVSPTLISLGVHHQYYVDAIIMFLIIPLFHLMNDEVTKGIIVKKGWYWGLKHMLGFQHSTAP